MTRTFFPSLAAEALRSARLHEKYSPWRVLEWTLEQTELPKQRDLPGRFGDPPITNYSGPRFHIDVYFWFHGTTTTHQHSFCGAFQLMHGSSIHSWYEFDLKDKVNSFCEIGDMADIIRHIYPAEKAEALLPNLSDRTAAIKNSIVFSPLLNDNAHNLRP
jgi:hypothetical protein